MANNLPQPAHSKLGASSYYRWKACPGSIRLCANLDSQESEYARIGTLAHETASNMLLGEGPPLGFEELTIEDMAAVTTYTDFVTGIIKAHSSTEDLEVMIEKRFDLGKYVPGAFGTADCVLYHKGLKKLVVIDYKHGAGLPVEVVENNQLLYYALGAMASLEVAPRSIEIVIVQPRCYHADGPIRRWITGPQRILDFIADLEEDAEATRKPDAPLNPGEHCRFCPAQAMHCPAVREKSLSLAREQFAPEFSYDPAKLAEALNNLEVIENWCKSVREFAYREAEHGRIPPGFKMVAKRSSRKWAQAWEPDKLAREFGLKPPDVVDVKVKSPAQLEKLIPKTLRTRLDGFVVQESSGNTLVPASDPRPPISAQAREVFEKITD